MWPAFLSTPPLGTKLQEMPSQKAVPGVAVSMPTGQGILRQSSSQYMVTEQPPAWLTKDVSEHCWGSVDARGDATAGDYSVIPRSRSGKDSVTLCHSLSLCF